jgi:uncharacterized integral membrane protein
MSDLGSNDVTPGESIPPVVPSPLDDDDQRRHHEHEAEAAIERVRHTRTSAAWVATVVAVLFGVALIDFIAQNTHDVRIEFFWANGHIPVAVALLAAALCGAIVVLAIGIGRVAQLRLNMRRQRRNSRRDHGKKSNQDQ